MAQQDQTGHGATLTFTPSSGEDSSGTDILSSLSIISITPPSTTCEVVDFPHLGMLANSVIPKAAAGGIDGGELSATIGVDPEHVWETLIGGAGSCVLTYPNDGSGAHTDEFTGVLTSHTPGALESGERLTADIVITKVGDSVIA